MREKSCLLIGLSRRQVMQAGALCLGSVSVKAISREAVRPKPLAEMARGDVVLAPGPAADQAAQSHSLLLGLAAISLAMPRRA